MKAKGFTLIELSVTLAVIAVLAAILTPLVTSYIDQARVTRAATDARAIATAYQLHKRDTSFYPVYTSLSNARAGTESEVDFASTTNIPTLGGSWTTTTTAGDIIDFLNNNKLTLNTSGNFRGGRIAYRGPYLDAIGDDPWGNAFLVNASNVDSDTNITYVLSAGPDGTLDTTRDQTTTTITVGNDDIAVRIN